MARLPRLILLGTASTGGGSVTLTAGVATQAQQSGTGAITQAQALVSALSTSVAQSGTGAITQAHATLTSAVASQVNQSGTGTLSATSALTGATSTQANAATTGTISQSQALVTALATEAHQSGTGALGAAVSLTSAASTQANSALAALISQSQIIVPADAVQANQAGTGQVCAADLTVIRPASDVAAGAWSASSGSGLYDMLNEAVADDGDYIHTATPNDTAEVALGLASDPGMDCLHFLRYRGKGRYTISLRQGADTEVAAWTEDDPDLTTHDRGLTAAQIATITDYSALRVRVVSAAT